MKVNVWEYLSEYEDERSDLLDAVDAVFGSGRLVLGASTTAFEREFADFHGRRHGVGVDNGTNALVLALQALGIGRGDEVITVSNTAAPTVVAICAVGAHPVFVDIDPETYLMDVEQLSEAISERTRCVLPVHLYGQAVDMGSILAVAAENDLAVLEDCAQAHGAIHQGQMVGSFGDAAAFSFYPTKVLGAYGDGGAVLVDTDEYHSSLRRLRYYGMGDEYHVEQLPGYNSRLDEVQAEILRRKLKRLGRYISSRQRIARRYTSELDHNGLQVPKVAPGNNHVYYLYVVRHAQRDEILSKLKERDIFLNISYPTPVHQMRGFAHLGLGSGSLPVTERASGEIFSLPMYPSLPDAKLTRVIDELGGILTTL